MQARVLGYVFNPLTLYWCHDADGVLRHVVAEVHNTYGGRHAYLLPPYEDRPAMVKEALRVTVQRRRRLLPGSRAAAGCRTRRDGSRCTATISRRSSPRCAAPDEAPASARSFKLQLVAPLAPLMGAMGIRVQGITLWLRRVPVVPRAEIHREGKGRAAVSVDITETGSTAIDSGALAGRGPSALRSAQLAAADRRSAVPPRGGPAAVAAGLSRRHRCRRRRPHTADDGDSPSRHARPQARPLRVDRLRRVLHGRRVELR